MRDNPDDLANQKIKRAIKELQRICNNEGIYSGPTTIMYLKKLIKDLKKQD
tara:strand:+ start:962 stop:1114 length:153 start_codon:yes stop_codon:yes gene_type:complete